MSLTTAEKAAGRVFRANQKDALDALNKVDPPTIRVMVVWHHVRHNCPAAGDRSVSIELRERYVYNPEYLEHGVPEKRFGFLWKEGKCSACGLTARSSGGRFVIAEDRPPERGSHGLSAVAPPWLPVAGCFVPRRWGVHVSP